MRLKVLIVALLMTSACAAASPLAPSEGPWRFSGTVFAWDGVQLGDPIASAELTVVSDMNLKTRVTSDAAGHFVFTGLKTGLFTVTIAAYGYISVAPVVDLYRDTEAHFALKPQ